MNKKMIVGAAVCAASILSVGAGAVDAGEVTGNGNAKAVNGNSECPFSGLEHWAADSEQPEGEVFVVPGVTQSWGQISKAERDFLRTIGVSPGELCNGHKNPQRP